MPAVRGMVAAAAQRRGHLWVETLIQGVGVAPELLDQPGACVTGEQYVALFQSLMEVLDDECLGLLPHALPRGSFALVARSCLGAPTAGAALCRLAQGFNLLLIDVRVDRLQVEGLTALVWRPADGACVPHNFLYEMLMRVSWRLLAWLHGGRLMPVRHEFPFSQPDYADIYPRIFPGPITFDRGRAAIWFQDQALAVPMRRDGAALEAFLRGCPGNVVLPWITTRATSARVLALLRRGEPTWPGMAEAARQLNLSVSTLQRRLTAEGTTFQLLKDQLRRDLAILKLSTSREPLARIAAELGFSESAVFQRAFKAWTGSAPGQYRRQTRAGGCAPS